MLPRIAFILSVIAAPCLAADKPADTKDAKDPAELQGTWKLVSVEANALAGELTEDQPRWVIKGTKILYGGHEWATLTAESDAKPKIIDLALADPKRVLEGIYSVEGDTLKVCLNRDSEGVKDRPQVFSTKDQ